MMASTAPRSLGEALRAAIRKGIPGTTRQIRRPRRKLTPLVSSPARWLSTTTTTPPLHEQGLQQEQGSAEPREDAVMDTIGGALGAMGGSGSGGPQVEPRWKQTPPAMKAPFALRQVGKKEREPIKVNEDPAVLDQFYARFLGPQWPAMLPEELKWLAVTHKSFDQGRRGFNDRLAYIGRRVILMELAKSIIATPVQDPSITDSLGRTPFEHPALAGLSNFGRMNPLSVFEKSNVLALGTEYGLPKVIRWVPRIRSDLESSGLGAIVMGSVQAIVGAVFLQHGGAVASTIVKDKIISRLL